MRSHALAGPWEVTRLHPQFEDFYAQHFALATRWAVGLTGQRADAEDLAHEALLKVEARFSRLDKPGAYLRRALVNVCRSWHRARTRSRLRELRSQDPANITCLNTSTVETLELLAGLPYKQRAAIVLRFWADWSDADIAKALACRASTVRVLVHRGVMALRSDITEEGRA